MNVQHTVMIFIAQYFVLLITMMTGTFGFSLLVMVRALVKMMRQKIE